MSMTVEVEGCLREDEVDDYRKFMVSTGFVQPFDSKAAIARLEDLDDDEDEEVVREDGEEDLPMIEPI